jgi:hypothetical protein
MGMMISNKIVANGSVAMQIIVDYEFVVNSLVVNDLVATNSVGQLPNPDGSKCWYRPPFPLPSRAKRKPAMPKPYESEFTLFMREWLEQHPEQQEIRRTGLALWQDRPQNVRARLDSAPPARRSSRVTEASPVEPAGDQAKPFVQREPARIE